jgi:hypothetical protein
VTEDAGLRMSSLSMSGSPSDALGVNAGITVSSRAETGMVGAGGAGAGLRLARTGRGVALGSMTSSTAGALFLVLSAFLAWLDIFNGDREVCDMMGMGAFGARCRLHGRRSFGGLISVSAARLRLGMEKDAGGEGRWEHGGAGRCLRGFCWYCAGICGMGGGSNSPPALRTAVSHASGRAMKGAEGEMVCDGEM